jgi:YD repeat-containing protein
MSKKIKNETVYRFNHVPGETIDPTQEFDDLHSYHEYDVNGNLLLEIAYTQDGDVADKVEYRYDQEGRLMETLVYGEDNEILERKEVIRNQEGNINREITHYLDGSADIQEYFYNDEGWLTGIMVKDDEDEQEYSEKYFYNGDTLVKVERLDEDGEVIFFQEDEYENGKLRSRKIFSAEETEPFTLVVDFNAAGIREQERRYDGEDNLVERNVFEHDESGRVARMIEENKQRKNTTEFEYDDHGNVIRQMETDLNGELNHEVLRTYNEDGELVMTTVETLVKASGSVRAYSLIFKRKYY